MRTLGTTLLAVALLALAVSCGPAVVTAQIRVGPPPLRVESPPPPPAPDAYWIAGHWRWEGGEYVWAQGHWVIPRPGEVYARAFWTGDGNGWHYHPGRWVRVAPPADAVRVVVRSAPPPVRVEVVRDPPSRDHFWVSGHWRWDGHDWDWAPGHWERHRPGHVWVAAHWVRSGPEWVFVGSHWQAE